MFIVASDHAGFELKEKIKHWFDKTNQKFFDCGAISYKNDDSYVDYAKIAIEHFKKNCEQGDFLLLICGSGVGMSIVANRDKKIRAVLAYNKRQAKQSRLHNNANCICLGARNTSFWRAKKIIKTFLNTNFLGGKYLERMQNIDK